MKFNFRVKKTELVQHVLSLIGRVVDNTVLFLNKDGLYSICTNQQTGSGLVLYINYKEQNFLDTEETYKLFLPDIKRFSRLLECVEQETMVLQVEDNRIFYKDDTFKFNYFLLEETALPKNILNVEKIKKLSFDHNFKLQVSKFNELVKGSAITVDSDKLYLYTKEDNVYGELNDRERQNINNIEYKLSTSFEGSKIDHPIAIGLENVRLFAGTKADVYQVKINTLLKIVCFECSFNNVELKYIISGLVK